MFSAVTSTPAPTNICLVDNGIKEWVSSPENVFRCPQIMLISITMEAKQSRRNSSDCVRPSFLVWLIISIVQLQPRLESRSAVEFPSDFRIFPISTGVGGKGMQKESIVYAAEGKKFIFNVKLRDSSHPSISINISSSKNNKRPQNVFNNSISFHSPFSFAKNGPKSFLISFKLFPFINQSSRSLWK